MKKLNIGILSLALVAGLGLVSCDKKNSNDVNNMGDVIKTKQDVYAYGAFSATSLLANNSGVETNLTSTITDEQLTKINKYVGMFESLTGENGFKQETVKNTDEAYKEYETKMIVKAGKESYVAYYNESPLNEKDKDDEDDDEIETSLDGIMLMNDKEFKITGTKEIEDDEVEIEMMSKIDNLNYVKVAQEIENGEQEFEYEVMTNGKIEYSSIEIEKENNEVEVELQFGKDDDSALIYEFEKVTNKDKSTSMEIKVYNGEDNLVEKIIVNTYIDPKTNNVVNEYIFEDGSKKKIDD